MKQLRERHSGTLGWLVSIILGFVALTLLANSGTTGLIIAFLLLTAGFSTFFIVSSGAIVPRILVLLGKEDEWWSPVRLLPSPGDISLMVKGTPAGPLYQLIHNVGPVGWYYRKEKNRFYKLTVEQRRNGENPEYDEEGPLARYLREQGVAWVGFNRSYHRRIRRYDSWERSGNGKDWGIVDKTTPEEDSHIFHFSTTMALRIVEAPAKGFYPVSFTVTWNVLMISPILAEFRAGKWEVQATSAVLSRSREYVAARNVEQLREERDSGRIDDFVDLIVAANFGRKDEDGKLLEGPNTVRLQPDMGIKIEAPQLVDPDFESGDVAMNQALREQEIARANVVTSEIRIEEERNKGKAEAARREEAAKGVEKEQEARDKSPHGPSYAWADAVKTAQPKGLNINLGQHGTGGILLNVDGN